MRTQQYVTPSGLQFTLREQTGADDEVLTSEKDESQLVNAYLANIITEGPNGGPMDMEAVKKLRLGDKYYLVIAGRILSLGETLYFQYQWEESQPAVEYSEDLSQYLWDYKEPFPGKENPLYFEQRIPPYPAEEFINLEVGEFKLRMDYLDGVGEAYILKMPAMKRTINQDLVARNLRVLKGNDWKKVVSFAPFTARQMVEIRNAAAEHDPALEGLTAITNPMSGEILKIPLLGIKDFFYPVKI